MIRILAALGVLMLIASAARAQTCTFSNTGVDFGNVSLSVNTAKTASGSFTASCSGTPNARIVICPNFGAGSGGDGGANQRYMTHTATNLAGNRLIYNLWETSPNSDEWGSNLTGATASPNPIIITLNGSGTAAAVNKPIYGQINAGQTTRPTGTYISTFSGIEARVQYLYSTSITSCRNTPTGTVLTQDIPFIVRTTNQSSCTVTATTLDFGTQTDLDTAKTATNTITVNCTNFTAYTLALSNGNNFAGGTRRMKLTTANEYIAYTVTAPASGTGTGVAQALTGSGTVPAQPTPMPAPGTYQDTVVVTLTY